MRRLKFLGNRRVEVVEADVPRPSPGEVLVRIRASALCGSEMEAFRSDREQAGNPGHEMVGEVADACGNESLTEGQRVAIHAVTSCGYCYWCQRGYELYCENLRGISNGHSEYVAAPARHCLPLPDDIDWDTGLMVGGDTQGVSYHAATRVGVKANDTAVAMGAGPVGLGHVLLLSFWGLRVAVVDMVPYRLKLAEKLGAEITINASEADVLAELRKMDDGRGLDFAFDCVGRPETLQVSMRAVRPRGTVVIIGERGETPIYPSRDIIHSELAIYGSWYFLRRDFYEMIGLVRRGLRSADMITHHYPLEQAQEAYDLMDAAQCGKIVFQI